MELKIMAWMFGNFLTLLGVLSGTDEQTIESVRHVELVWGARFCKDLSDQGKFRRLRM